MNSSSSKASCVHRGTSGHVCLTERTLRKLSFLRCVEIKLLSAASLPQSVCKTDSSNVFQPTQHVVRPVSRASCHCRIETIFFLLYAYRCEFETYRARLHRIEVETAQQTPLSQAQSHWHGERYRSEAGENWRWVASLVCFCARLMWR